MKNLTNILSYLWLLLLMAVTACSDLEEEVGPMHVEEEVELNIQLHVPDMQASTRTAPTESITAITAYAFDSNSQLIKVVKAILSIQDATSGDLKIKVPKRTGDIHFIAKNNAESPDVTISIGDNVSTLLSQTTDDLHYWGKATYNEDNDLSVTLTRNMAKLTLKTGGGFTPNSCYIAGFVNRNLSGTIVPSGYAVGDTPTIPNGVTTHTYTADNSLGNVYYLFEHANVENSNPLYVIIEVAAKYYKVAFAAGDEYFPIIRNHEYTITIDGIDAMYAEDSYDAAVKSTYPINDLVIDGVSMTVTASPTEVLNQSGQKCTVTVTIPGGITELNVPTHDAFTITPPNGLTEQDGKYTVTPGSNYAFTFTVKDGVEAGNKTISFSGRGKYKSATGSATVTLEDKKTVSIVAVPSATTLNYAASSVEDLLVNVTIPKAVTGLTFSSSDFTIKVASGELVAVENEENSYTITHDENATETKVPVRIRLNDNVSSQTALFTFNGTSDDANVEVQSVTKEITLTAADDANVRWQGNVPLSSDNDSIMVPLLYNWFCKSGTANIPINSRLQFEFDVTSDSESYFEITEIRGSSNEWNNPAFSFPELANGYRYNAITSGEGQVIVTMNQDVFDIILENYQSSFLGDTDVAMAIRGAGITLEKVSVLPPAEVTPTSNILVTAPGATEGVSEASVDISYSNSSAIEEYTITVTVPDGVTELNYTNNGFSNVYIDSDNGWYNDAQSPIAISDNKSIPLRLRVNKNNNSNPTITFSANNVESATFTVNRTTSGSNDSNVLWEGALLFQGYDVHVSKINIPNSFLQGKLLDGAVFTLDYEVVDDSNDFISLYGSGVSNWSNLENMADAGEYTDNNTSTITLILNASIVENIGNSSLNMQGRGRVLKKVTLTPPANVTFDVLEETVSLDLATNEAVLHVQKPANVTQLTITDNDNLFGTVSTTFANATVNGKTINNLPNYAATIPVTLEITRVVDIKDYTITVAGNDGSSDNVTVELLTTWSGSHSLGNWEGFWGSARKLPVGSTIQITFADYNNCSFELHTYKSSTEFGYDLRLDGYSTTANDEDYISTSHLTNGVFTFTVATDGSIQIRNNGNLNNVTDAGLDGLQINGNNGLSITQVNVTLGSGGTTTPTGFTYTFEDGVEFGEWNNNITTDIVYDATLGSNVLKMVVSENDNKFGQIGISNGDYSGSYTLSIKYRAESSTGNMNLVFQDEANNYAERKKHVEGTLSTSWKEITWNLNLTEHADQFVIQFEQVDANATFYIDDLKLVKNN